MFYNFAGHTFGHSPPLPHWLPLQHISNQALGHCLGGKGINLLMRTLQNRLVDHGYITTRVLAPQQDLNSGELKLVVVPGKVRQVKLTPDSGHAITLYSAFPAHEGKLLDLRDIEQGLENLQRLPTVQANMEILPGNQPGESDIALHWQQQRMWRVGASLDDSGTRSTGRYQGGLTLSLDNPFSLSDLFYLSASSNLESKGSKGSDNITGHYSVPFGYMGDEKGRQSRTSFMYGAGVQINPIENVAIDIGYEGSSIDDGNKSHTINGFNIAVGYRF